jgi:hypothetical protein
MLNPYPAELVRYETRRHFLARTGNGVGAMALASLLGPRALRAAAATPTPDGTVPKAPPNPLSVRPPHFAPKAERVIYLHLTGSPPHLDMYDYKPQLVKHDGEPCPDELIKGKRFAFTSGVPKLLGTKQDFAQHGKSGAWLSGVLPHLATVVDEMCFIKSMHTDQFNHAPAELLLYTGSAQFGRPSMGSWVTYGLGSENQNLPGFIVLVSSGTQPNAGKMSFGSGFLPSVYQGVQCRSVGDPVLYVSNPAGMDVDMRRMTLDALRDLNERQVREFGDPETVTRIAQYELAFRMQMSVPDVMDISKEPKETLERYGAKPGGSSFANNVLLARRLAEQGVRFIQLFDWGWDFHGTRQEEDIKVGLPKKAATVDTPIAALIADLKERGLLDTTLIVCGGEFGRTPFREGRTSNSPNLGRDHHPDCYTMWLAGGGVKPGMTYGASDELGYRVGEDPVHVHDLQATILHLLGLNHERLTFRFQGRDYRLTDVAGKVVKPILA